MRRSKRVAKKWIRGPVDLLAIERGCYFDEDRGQEYIDFMGTYCRQSRDRWAGKPIELIEWQKDFIKRLFGWRRADGRRRFTTAYLEIPKKNGKSTLVSALVTSFTILEDGGAPETFLNAVDRDQASIVFDEAANMIRSSPALAGRLEVIDSRKRIINAKNRGVIRANSADSVKQDGVNASLVVFDELHRFKDRGLWDVMKYAGASRDEPLRVVITTAGEDESGPWFEQRCHSLEVNSGAREDVEHLGIVYAVEEGDDLDSPKTWQKVNPSLGHTIRAESFAKDYQSAKEDGPLEWAKFARLRLGKIVKSSAAFVALEVWDRGKSPAIILPGDPVFIGVDLSTADDLTAMATLKGSDEDGYDLKLNFWLPDEDIGRLEKEARCSYRVWEREGLIELIPGPVIDYDRVRDAILETVEANDVVMILVDPYNAYKLCMELKDKYGLPVEFVRQGFLSLSPPTKELLRMLKSGKVRHGGNPILRQNVVNAILEADAAGNIKLTKKRSRGKIDGLAATVNAVAGISSGREFEGESVYENQGITFL